MNLPKKQLSCLGTALMVGALSFAGMPAAYAGKTLKIDDTKWVSIGAGLRTSFSSVEDAAPSGSNSNDFALDSIRLYLSGQIHEYVKFTFNTEREDSGDIRVLDGIAQFEFSDLLNVWMGRFLPPSDRSNFSGPYFLNAWDFPFVQAYPAIFAGRDDGAALWGQLGKGRFKYQVGAFEGRQDGSNQDDNLLYSGRLTLNLWDPEPGYYNSSSYYGSKDILALGLVAMSQEDGAGTQGDVGDFSGWNVDFLMEKRIGRGGAATLEAAYYDYDLDNVSDSSLVEGDGYFVLGSYLMPQKIGFGRLQPGIRFQEFDFDNGGSRERIDYSLSYIIDGHNARVTFLYATEDPAAGDDFDIFRIGVQLQI